MATWRNQLAPLQPTRNQPSNRYLASKKKAVTNVTTLLSPLLVKVRKQNEKGPPGKVGGFGASWLQGAAQYPVMSIERGVASRRVDQDFVDAWAIPGVYGLVDPLTDHVAYVGRSVNIGQRYRQHLRMDGGKIGSALYDRNRWFKALMGAASLPGLVLLDHRNEAWLESRMILALRKRGWCELNVAD